MYICMYAYVRITYILFPYKNTRTHAHNFCRFQAILTVKKNTAPRSGDLELFIFSIYC